jgi:signal transduction histidine kinase
MTLATRMTKGFTFTTSLVIRIVLRASTSNVQTQESGSVRSIAPDPVNAETLSTISPRVGTMKTLTPEGGSREQVEALDAAMHELASEPDWPHTAERALTLALDLTGATISFMVVDDQADGGRHVYSKAAQPLAKPSDDEIDQLMAATAPIGTSYMQTLVAGGRAVGTIGVVNALGLTNLQLAEFGVLARQVAASFEIARLSQQRQELIDSLVNMRADLDRSERQRVVSEERARSAERLEQAHEMAVQALIAVSTHVGTAARPTDFYGRLSASVAKLVGADKVLFWQLNENHTLTAMPGGYGVDEAFMARLYPARCDPDSRDLTSLVVYHDLIFRADRNGGPGESTRILDVLGVSSAISAPWRAGGQRLGVIAAYDSSRPGGFSPEDAWVLQMAGLEAGLVWQLKHAEADLTKTVARLQKVDAARHLLLKNMSTAVDKARKRFADELHDDALQKLTAAELHLRRADDSKSTSPISEAQSLLQQAEDAIRRLMFELRPPDFDVAGSFDQIIRDRVTMLRSLTGIDAQLEVELSEELPHELKSSVFRQVAEALANVEKHAGAKTVQVALKMVDSGIHGIVADDGQGFVVAERDHLPGHIGLLALNERALLAGGWCTIESEPGVGTKVEFWFPTAN